jgi:peptidoglycan/xylan/chitin deacetylase (PgdA/CDA1 family)
MKALVEVITSLSFAKRYDFGPSIAISFDVESPADSYIQDINAAKDLGFRGRMGLARLIEAASDYEVPFTLFSTGHALLKECRGHKSVIRIIKRNRKYGFRAGEYVWHLVDPGSNYVENPEFYYGDLIEEAVKSGVSEIASHSFSHIPYSLVDDEVAENDLKRSIEALRLHGIEAFSFAFPFNLAGKFHIFQKHGIKMVRIGHRALWAISYRNGTVIIKTHITDFSITSLKHWRKIADLLSKKKTLLSWYLHPVILYDENMFNIFKEIIKYLKNKEITFLTFRELYDVIRLT